MDLTLTAKMRPDLMTKKGRLWKQDGRTGEMHLRFFTFFGMVKPGAKQKDMLKALLDEYFTTRCEAEVTLDDYFNRSLQLIEEKMAAKKDDDQWKTYKENLLTNRKLFDNLRLSTKENKNNSSKIVEYMNKYNPKYDKYFFRFRYKNSLVLMDAVKVIFVYESNAEGLMIKDYPGSRAWDVMYEQLQDIELDYKCSVKKLRTLGKNGMLRYQGREYRLLSYCKFLNPDEDVEFGYWKNDKKVPFLFLNQSDRYMSVCPESGDDVDDGFVFNLEEFADAL